MKKTQFEVLSDMIKELSSEMYLISESQTRIIEMFNERGVRDLLQELNVKFSELANITKQNLIRANGLTNELKGIVSMSRAALQEGKSFTQLCEFPVLLNVL